MIKINKFQKTAVNIIKSEKYPRMRVSGLSRREKINSDIIIRRLTGNKITIEFKLLKPQKLNINFSFCNNTRYQKFIIEINGLVYDKKSIWTENKVVKKKYKFSGQLENKIVINFLKTQEIEKSYFTNLEIFSRKKFFIYTPKTDGIRFLGDPEKNAKLARQEYESGQTKLESLPPVVTFALTTYCNNRIPCLICDRNSRLWTGDCETDNFVIEQLTPLLKTAKYILLHCGGEAMFSKQFDYFISNTFAPTKISFATNAMLMTNKRSDLMLEKDIMSCIVVSLDASTPEVYRYMRPSCDFDTVVKNISYYTKLAKKLNRKDAKIKLNMTLCKANITDAPGLIDLAVKVGAYGVDFNHLNEGNFHKLKTVDGWIFDYADQIKFDNPAQHDQYILEAYNRAKEKGIHITFVGQPFLDEAIKKKYSAIASELCGEIAFQTKSKSEEDKNIEKSIKNDDIWFSPYHKKFMSTIPLCVKPWQETVISPNGDVRMCYFHETSKFCMGNVLEQDFIDIWNSETFVRERQAFLDKSFSQICRQSAPCLHRNRK